MTNKFKVYFLICVAILSALPVVSQSGGTFEIKRSIIAAGGQTSSGGVFAIDGSLGQSAAEGAASGGTFSMTSGFWNPIAYGVGLEGDVAGRPDGDGSVLSNDVIMVRRFFNGTAVTDIDTNEFQRADVAPRATFGDGTIASNDIIQTRRYQNGTDVEQNAAGPQTEGSNLVASAISRSVRSTMPNSAMAPRELRVESTTVGPGFPVTINIRVDALGDEAGYGFRLNYNNAVLLNPVIGPGNAGAAVRSCNAIATGLNCAVDTFPNNLPGSSDPNIGEITAGNDQILITVRFNVAANAPLGILPITLTNVNASNDNADLIPITGTNGQLLIAGPSAASVSISGRAVGSNGNGLSMIRVSVAGGSLSSPRSLLTNNLGYFLIDDLEAGHTYIVTVSSKTHRFSQPSQIVSVGDDVSDIVFQADADN